MMDKLLVYSTSNGMNTVADQAATSYDPDVGIVDLAKSSNVRIDQSGRQFIRPSVNLVQAGNMHSLFCDKGDCFILEDLADSATIHQVGTDLSLRPILPGMKRKARMAFCQVNHETYFCNGYQKGIIVEGVPKAWAKQEHVGPKTTRQFSGPPVGNHLAHHASRLWVAEGPVIWISEPYAYGKFDKARHFFHYPGDVLMIKSVDTGVFVSDRKKTYFLEGTDPGEMRSVEVADYPAIEWSDAIESVEGREAGLEVKGKCALWVSPEGVCAGTPAGQVLNLNKEKVIYPEKCRTGAGLLHGYDFIHTMA